MPKKQITKPLTKKEIIKLKAKVSTQNFKREMKKAMNTAIVAAFGFVIALVWKDVITEWVSTITGASPVHGKIIEAILVTIIAVIGIIIVTRIFSEKK
ncbi:MAG: hypothetical protein KKF48_00570 [Nanoarchaeota archaeon]|nr:hypothetical protein [Nanoarchaeota archaeon]MBU1027516.1 hypothetical protein [Nanoarchaeota archaeon]